MYAEAATEADANRLAQLVTCAAYKHAGGIGPAPEGTCCPTPPHPTPCRWCHNMHAVLVHTPCSIGMSHMAECTCCSSVAFERPNESTFTFTPPLKLHSPRTCAPLCSGSVDTALHHCPRLPLQPRRPCSAPPPPRPRPHPSPRSPHHAPQLQPKPRHASRYCLLLRTSPSPSPTSQRGTISVGDWRLRWPSASQWQHLHRWRSATQRPALACGP